MKKTITLILSLALMLSLLAGCGEKSAKKDAPAGETSGESTNAGDLQTVYVQSTINRYDESGRLDDSWTQEYDANGNMIKMTEQGYTHTYTYDSGNRMTDRLTTRSDGSVYQHYTYQYDANGNQILRTEEYSEYHYEYATSYNDQGLRTEVVCTQNGKLFSTDTYSYDEQGRVVDYVDGTMNSRTHYVYTDNTVAEQDVSDDGSKVYEETVYTYDENGKLLKEEFFESGELLNYDEYTRDSEGKALEMRGYSVYDGQAQLRRKMVYTYDENGNLTEKNIYENDELSLRLVYTYTQLRVSPQRAQELLAQMQKDAD